MPYLIQSSGVKCKIMAVVFDNIYFNAQLVLAITKLVVSNE